MRPSVALDYRPALLSQAGIGRAVRELARALALRDDVELHLFGHSLARRVVHEPVPTGAKLHRQPIPGRSLRLLARLGIGADRLAGGVDVFHWTDFVQPPVTRAKRVHTLHDLAFLRDRSWHGPDATRLADRTRAMVQAADLVVTPSRATAEDARNLLGCTTPLRVIPFGGDHVPQRQPARPDLEHENYLLCVGTIEPRKNHLGLLHALRESSRPLPHLVVAGGRGWECDRITTELLQAQSEGRLTWIENADDAQIFALLAHCRALVYPSQWEGFGFPPLEAMAMGIPVVAHDCAPMRELTDGHAVLTDCTAPQTLSEALQQITQDEGLRRTLETGGRARAAAFRWADSAEAYRHAYAEICR